MSSYLQCYLHIVFSTKYRRPWLLNKRQERLFGFMAGILKDCGGKGILIGGMPDHVHIRMMLSSLQSIGKTVMHTKGRSSSWFKAQFPEAPEFQWQKGFAAFSFEARSFDRITRYIQNQESHHSKKGFVDEYVDLLVEHNIPYDPNNLFEDEEDEESGLGY